MKKLLIFLVFALVFVSSCANQEVKEIKTVKDYEKSIDYSCKEDSDCEIKNVNKCCGYFTECVNKNAKIDMNLVSQLCSQENKVSICGFMKINYCECFSNKCVGKYDPKLEMSN